ncbi:MAG: hypothetical protein FJ149_02155 [Euryarchaeota archaeon]|nr:hypothetical protein [Euryarchaeota archaeon]
MRRRKFGWGRDRDAISGAVTAVMLLLIISSVISIVMVVFVPAWGESDESQHMRRTLEQFYALRENIDAQVLRDSPVSTSSKITLGNAPSALLGFSRSTGRIVSNPFNGSLSVHNQTDPADIFALSRGNLTYTSQNYYIDQQSYIYEQGAILVAGPRDAAVRAPPHFGVSKDDGGNLSVSMLFVSIAGDFSSFTGTENAIIETRLVVRDANIYEGGEWTLGRNIRLNLTTPYPGAWARYFNSTLTTPLTNLTWQTQYNLTVGAGFVALDLMKVRRLDLGVAVVEVRIK